MNRSLLAIITILIAGLLIFYFFSSQQYHLTLSAGRSGGIYKPLADSIAAVVQKNYPEIHIKVLESNGGTENFNRLNDREADLGIIENEIPSDNPITVLTPLHREYLHFFVRKDANIHSINDLEGKKVSIGPVNSGTEKLIYRILYHYGVDTRSFQPINLAFGEAQKEILAGSIDAALFLAGLRAEICDLTLQSGQVKLIAFGDADQRWGEAEGFVVKYPYMAPAVIPIFTYPVHQPETIGEPQEPVATFSLQALLVARRELPEDVTNKITESIFKSRHSLIQAHISAIQISEKFNEGNLRFPLHDGARDYYERNEPLFVVKYAESMALAVSLLLALMAIRQWYGNRQKNRIDKYYSKLDKIYAKVRDQNTSRSDIKQIQEELPRILHDAFSELVAERLLANESFVIFLQLYVIISNRIQQRLESAS